MTIVTAMVSPSARPSPRMTAPNNSFFGVTQHGDARDFPARRAERVGGFALQAGTERRISRETDVMMGMIMMARMMPAASMLGP